MNQVRCVISRYSKTCIANDEGGHIHSIVIRLLHTKDQKSTRMESGAKNKKEEFTLVEFIEFLEN